MRVLRAEDLVDATWTGVQDVRAIVDVTHRDTGEHLGRAASAVAHDSGTTPTWGDRGRHGRIRVRVPASYPPESLRIIISLESQSYVAEHVDLGHAETDFFAPSTERVLQVDPRGTLSCRVGYTPPDPRHVPRADSRRPSSRRKRSRPTSAATVTARASLERTPLFEPAVRDGDGAAGDEARAAPDGRRDRCSPCKLGRSCGAHCVDQRAGRTPPARIMSLCVDYSDRSRASIASCPTRRPSAEELAARRVTAAARAPRPARRVATSPRR